MIYYARYYEILCKILWYIMQDVLLMCFFIQECIQDHMAGHSHWWRLVSHCQKVRRGRVLQQEASALRGGPGPHQSCAYGTHSRSVWPSCPRDRKSNTRHNIPTYFTLTNPTNHQPPTANHQIFWSITLCLRSSDRFGIHGPTISECSGTHTCRERVATGPLVSLTACCAHPPINARRAGTSRFCRAGHMCGQWHITRQTVIY